MAFSLGGGGGASAPAAPKLGGGTAEISICPKGSKPVAKTLGRYDPKTGKTAPSSCPPGATPSSSPTQCCQSSAGAGGGLPDLGGMLKGGGMIGPGGPGGGTPWTPSSLERPALNPVNPKAEYDPKIAEALARQTQYGTMLEQGSGHAMDVLQQGQADEVERQVAQARAAAAQAGIPFDEASFRATAMRGINAAMAQEKGQREAQLGEAYKAQAGTAGQQAGERDTRLSLDQARQLAQNQELLQRYGIDVQKYGMDAQAATAANNALMDFYSRLMGGMFSMFGGMGGGSMSITNQPYYG